jgi:hypothetical protein
MDGIFHMNFWVGGDAPLVRRDSTSAYEATDLLRPKRISSQLDVSGICLPGELAT